MARGERGKGVAGELLRAARRHARERLGVRLATAGIGTRNRASYSLLTGLGFRPVRQHFLMRCDEMPRPPRFEAASVEMAKPEHADAILEIYAARGFERPNRKAMSDTLANGRHAHSVVIQDGAIVAFAELETHWSRRVWVSYVGVTQAARDKGLGTALVTWSVRRQFDAGSNSALLLLSPANRTALLIYEKSGFRRHRLVDVLEQPF